MFFVHFTVLSSCVGWLARFVVRSDSLRIMNEQIYAHIDVVYRMNAFGSSDNTTIFIQSSNILFLPSFCRVKGITLIERT